MTTTAIRNFAVAARAALLTSVTERAAAFGVTNDTDRMQGRSLTGTARALRGQLIGCIRADGFAQTIEAAAYTWFKRLIALRYLEVNGFLEEPLLAGAEESAFRERLTEQCKALADCLPEIFGGCEWAELLLPEGLLAPDGVVTRLCSDIPEADWHGNVQLIGWLYQYYNTVPKDQVFADLKRNIKLGADRIPAATQLFTPDWIVRYLVENSLGRLWAEAHGIPDGADWQYYLTEPPQEDSVREALRSDRDIRPEEITFLDPCMGCGHILVYAFDVLMQLYLSCGWTAGDAARLILRRNLCGLDIDRRVYELACFSVRMRATVYDRSILTEVISLRLAHFADAGETAAVCGSLLEPEDLPDAAQEPLRSLLGARYDVVCTNPPYMGSSSMDPVLSDFVKAHYPAAKADLFACFIERCVRLTRPQGYCALLTMQSWMFLVSFAALRQRLLEQDVVSLVHLGPNAFGQGDVGTIVQTAAFVLRRTDLPTYYGRYLDLSEVPGSEKKRQAFLEAHKAYAMQKTAFRQLPTSPFVYWASAQTLRLFAGRRLGEIAAVRQGMTTSDNDRFIRRWYEVDAGRICFDATDAEAARRSGRRWFPYNKGGGYRKWYGNHEYVVNFEDDGRELRAFHALLNRTSAGGRIKNREYYFRRCIAWTFIATTPGFRQCPPGFIFDVAGSSLFLEDESLTEYVTALLCSTVTRYLLRLLNPTMNIQAIDIRSLPYLEEHVPEVTAYARENTELCRKDWDSFETSWDFRRHPLLRPAATLREAYAQWAQECGARFDRLKANEEALNRIFIAAYGLGGELDPAVEDKDVTVRRADLQRELRSLVSYVVGCLFGRYSVDREGLCSAGSAWDAAVCPAIRPFSVIPVSEGFAEDLTARIIGFLETVWGEAVLEENLQFLAEGLGGSGTPREVLRRYLQGSFFADHCRCYQKRPIYWMFSSGRLGAFKALVYLHCWDCTTIGTVRRYVQEAQVRCHAERSRLAALAEGAAAAVQRRLQKQLAQLDAQAEELAAYEARLAPLEGFRPDLDDGVKANYARLAGVLERIR